MPPPPGMPISSRAQTVVVNAQKLQGMVLERRWYFSLRLRCYYAQWLLLSHLGISQKGGLYPPAIPKCNSDSRLLHLAAVTKNVTH